MTYLLFKLSFDTPVHFGLSDSALSLYQSQYTCAADTLFSALCHMALDCFGNEGVNELCSWARQGELLLSDAMPWCGGDIFLPKPCAAPENRQELPAKLRKAMKKLEWIPIDAFGEFAASLHGEKPYDADGHQTVFGREEEITKIGERAVESGTPYMVGTYRFCADCGLYFLAACAHPAQTERLARLVEVLGITGIGGKISAGYGKFHVQEKTVLDASAQGQLRWLYEALQDTAAAQQMLLTTSLPTDTELDGALEGALFRVVRRGGFVQSEHFAAGTKKKQTQYFLASGSVLRHRFEGELYSIADGGNHPVFRYGKPLFVGVKL